MPHACQGVQVCQLPVSLYIMDVSTRHRSTPPLGIGSGKEPALHRSRTTMLLVDFINPLQFPGAEQLAPHAVEAAAYAAALKARVTRRGVQCIYANDNYGTWHSEFADVMRHCIQLGGPSRQIAELLAPKPQDLTIVKPRQSAFFCTPLELLLGQMRTRHLIIVGLAADICVQFTAMDAHLRGYELWVPEDCTASETVDRKELSMAYLQRVLNADTRPAVPRLHGRVRLPPDLPHPGGLDEPPPGEEGEDASAANDILRDPLKVVNR